MALTIPINTSKVRDAISENTNNVGDLCRSDKINKWSKWKPVRYPTAKPLTQAQLEATNFGIKMPIYSNVQAYVNGITMLPNVLPIWEYEKPLDRCRLGDFRNYEHNSVIPFGLFVVTNQATKTGGNPIITATMGFVEGSDPYQLRLQDFNLGNRRFAMAYRKSGESTIKTVRGNIGEFSVDLNVNDENLTVGSYEAFLFLTNNAGGTANDIIGLEGHPRPNIFEGRGLIFKVVTQSVTLSIEARYVLGNRNKISIQVKANNETGAAVNLSNSILQIRSATNECDSTIQSGEKFIGLNTVVAPTGLNTIYNDIVTIVRDDFPMWKVCWRNGGFYPNDFFSAIIQETT